MVLLYFIGMAPYISPPNVVETDYSPSISYIFGNIQDEYPRVLNFGINESMEIEHLENFTRFVQNYTKARGLDYSVFWLVFQNVSDDVNVTVGSFGETINVTMNVSGEFEYLYLEDGSTGSVMFTDPPGSYNITVVFNSNQTQLSLEKYKTSIYFQTSVTRGGNVLRGKRLA